MYIVEHINSLEQFLEHTQIVSVMKDQMDYIGSPKTRTQIMETIKLAFSNESSYLIVISDEGVTIGFAFYNIAVGMESAGKYIWLNEMHIHSEYRSQGYGALLFDEIVDWCKRHNIVRIMGMADENEENTLRFYKKQGADIYKQNIIHYRVLSF